MDVSLTTRSWIARAGELAVQHKGMGAYHLGAVAVRGGSLISVGWNRRRNHSQYGQEGTDACPIPRFAWSFCAEEICLRRSDRVEGATLYVARVTPGGRYSIAKPCRKCADLALESGISKIVYTTMGGGITVVKPRILVQQSLLGDTVPAGGRA